MVTNGSVALVSIDNVVRTVIVVTDGYLGIIAMETDKATSFVVIITY